MDWMTLIQNFGFQVCCCIAMGWYVYDRGEKERQDRKEADIRHKDEIDKLSEMINNNTLVMQKLLDKLEV